MTALEACICSMRLKPRNIGAAWRAARRRLRFSAPVTDEAPNATRRPPARSIP